MLETIVRAFEPADMPALRAVLAEPAIAEQYDMYAGADGAERLLADPYTPAAGVRLAFVGGEPAGFACAIVLPGPRPWAMLRGGVRPPFQRRGIGRALHESAAAFVREQTAVPGVAELALAAWQPLESATAMVERMGYRHDRWFWLMRRERGASAPAPAWPDGIRVRTFDGSEAMLHEWRGAYHDSFAEHYRFVAGTVEQDRRRMKQPGFRPDGVLLAHRDDRCVGFCACVLHPTRGEIGTLGTTRAARGIGLGRALLRWGVAWLERESPLPVTLLVDGANEGALGLYRSEGFEVARTRRIWARPA